MFLNLSIGIINMDKVKIIKKNNDGTLTINFDDGKLESQVIITKKEDKEKLNVS